MTRDQIIAVAKEIYGTDTQWKGVIGLRLEALAKRFIAIERQACIDTLEQVSLSHLGNAARTVMQCVAALEARNEDKPKKAKRNDSSKTQRNREVSNC